MDITSVEVAATLAAKVTFASHQNSVPILRELKIENTGDEPLNDVVVTGGPTSLDADFIDRVPGPAIEAFVLARLQQLDPSVEAAADLAQRIQRVAGAQPHSLTLQHLLDSDIPVSWVDQRARLGFPAA